MQTAPDDDKLSRKMRGDILLVDSEGLIDYERLGAAGLRVYHANDVGDALERLSEGAARDVVVVSVPPGSEAVDQLRRRADYATSIIVVGRDDGERDSARPFRRRLVPAGHGRCAVRDSPRTDSAS